MRKSYVWILVVFVAIALIGLVVIQLYWIKNAINTKEAQFDLQVNSAMNDMVLLMQKEETAFHLLNEIDNIPSDTITQSSAKSNKKNYNNEVSKPLNFSKEINLHSHSGHSKLSAQISVIPGDSINTEKGSITWNTRSVNNYTSSKKLNSDIKNIYTQSVNNKTQLVESIVNKLLQSHLNIEERIDEKILLRVIKTGLIFRGIDLQFEYAVKSSTGDASFKSEDYTDSISTRRYIARLFPEDIFDQPNFLVIYFPNRQSYILNSMGFMVFSSIALTTIIIIVLIITVWVILKQKRLSEVKTDFINNMTHELKTPISTISLASQMISDVSIPKEAKNTDHLGGVILEESKRLGMLVEKVLQMAVYEKGNLKLKIKEVDINKLINNVVNNFSIQVKNRNGQIIKELDATNAKVMVDEIHITNAIINLLDNAAKYCNVEPLIVISTRNKGNMLLIEVKDNGIGISKENQKRLFEQFYRVPTGNLHNVRGFGLGLNYVKKIAEAHKGTIVVDSKPAHGSTFTIQLNFKNIG